MMPFHNKDHICSGNDALVDYAGRSGISPANETSSPGSPVNSVSAVGLRSRLLVQTNKTRMHHHTRRRCSGIILSYVSGSAASSNNVYLRCGSEMIPEALLGLVVTCLPKVTLRKALYFNGL
jgi:hypothetical protein